MNAVFEPLSIPERFDELEAIHQQHEFRMGGMHAGKLRNPTAWPYSSAHFDDVNTAFNRRNHINYPRQLPQQPYCATPSIGTVFHHAPFVTHQLASRPGLGLPEVASTVSVASPSASSSSSHPAERTIHQIVQDVSSPRTPSSYSTCNKDPESVLSPPSQQGSPPVSSISESSVCDYLDDLDSLPGFPALTTGTIESLLADTDSFSGFLDPSCLLLLEESGCHEMSSGFPLNLDPVLSMGVLHDMSSSMQLLSDDNELQCAATAPSVHTPMVNTHPLLHPTVDLSGPCVDHQVVHVASAHSGFDAPQPHITTWLPAAPASPIPSPQADTLMCGTILCAKSTSNPPSPVSTYPTFLHPTAPHSVPSTLAAPTGPPALCAPPSPTLSSDSTTTSPLPLTRVSSRRLHLLALAEEQVSKPTTAQAPEPQGAALHRCSKRQRRAEAPPAIPIVANSTHSTHSCDSESSEDEEGLEVFELVSSGIDEGACSDCSQQGDVQPAKRAYKRKRGSPRKPQNVVCRGCGTTSTPQWRCGPEGPRTLCNACGVRYKKGLPLRDAPDSEHTQHTQQAQAMEDVCVGGKRRRAKKAVAC